MSELRDITLPWRVIELEVLTDQFATPTAIAREESLLRRLAGRCHGDYYTGCETVEAF